MTQNHFIQKLKRAFASALLLLIIFAIGASALLIPKPAAADGVRDALDRAGLTSAAEAYARIMLGQRSSPNAPQNPANRASRTNGDICKAQLPLGIAPRFNNPKLNEGLTKLCFTEYAVVFSAKTRTPLWSAEYLTKERVISARSVTRQNTFHEEEGLPASARSRLTDYVRSGYDRGHMAPSGSASNPTAQNETFSLANIVPQEPNNNRNLWASIEIGSRDYAQKHGALNVITGPLFLGDQISFLKDRIAIPTHLWKLVYDPVKHTGGVYFVENIDTKDVAWKSIADFETLTGYDFGLGKPGLMPMPALRKRT